ncbi:predicted protein [Histoplasma capsulatum H143]|uniref:Uncharacterized protein n=1 Tax=Ajellomyces capsulatus (strain H143) TaxID=544712 RepID=C6H7H9_AJECH|nr:predicted protein [Histoplasma capsulatum H143]
MPSFNEKTRRYIGDPTFTTKPQGQTRADWIDTRYQMSIRSSCLKNPLGVFHNRIRMVHNPLVIRDFPNISVKPLHVKMIKKGRSARRIIDCRGQPRSIKAGTSCLESIFPLLHRHRVEHSEYMDYPEIGRCHPFRFGAIGTPCLPLAKTPPIAFVYFAPVRCRFRSLFSATPHLAFPEAEFVLAILVPWRIGELVIGQCPDSQKSEKDAILHSHS